MQRRCLYRAANPVYMQLHGNPAAASLAPTSLMLGNFVTGISVLAPAGMLLELSADLGVSVRDAGLLITVGAIVLGIGSPVTAWLTGRIERRRLLVVTVAVMAITNLASAFATGFAMLLATRVLMLAVGVIFTPQAAGVVGQIVPPEKRASTIAFAFLGWSLASAVGLPVVTLIASSFGWRSAYVAIAALGFVSTLLLAWRLPAGLPGTPVALATWASLARNRLVVVLLLATMIQIGGQFVVFAYAGPLLKVLTGASPQMIGLVFGLYGVGGFVGSVIATRIVDRIGAYKTSMIFTACLLTGVTVWAFGAGWLLVMAIGVAIWGLGFAATNAMQQARLVAAAPDSPSAAVSLNTSVLYIGQAIGAGLGGFFYGREMFHAPGFSGAAMIAFALFLIWTTRRGDARPSLVVHAVPAAVAPRQIPACRGRRALGYIVDPRRCPTAGIAAMRANVIHPPAQRPNRPSASSPYAEQVGTWRQFAPTNADRLWR